MAYEKRLEGKTVVILAATGSHDHEFWYPYYRFREEGAEVVVAGLAKGTVYGEGRHGTDGLPIEITHTVEEAAEMDIDCLYIPGGIYNCLELRVRKRSLDFVRDVAARGKIICAICHSSWVLVSAGLVKGRRISCPDDMADDVNNAGGTYTEEPAVRDGQLITSTYFGYLPEHFRLVIPALVEG